MKKFGFFLSLGLVFLFSFSFAAIEDTQIVDELNKKQQEEMLQQSQELTENFTFNQVNSCDAMETVFSDFLELYKKYYPKRDYSLWDMIAGGFGGDFGVVMTDTMETESVSATVENQKILVPQVGGATDDSFSTTNLQKVGVDEPEIFKSNGKYLFYYVQDSTNQKYVSVIKAPTTSDLQDAEIVKKILIPTSLSNVQLFLQGDILVILASRYSNIQSDVLGSQHTVAIIYDISDLNDLKLQKMVDVVGSFSDARVIGDDLYLISQINLNWYSFAYDLPVIRFSDVIPQTTQLILDEQGDKEVQLGSKALSYQKQTLKAPCKDIFYLLPTEEALKEYGALPNFTLVSKISLSNTSQSVTQKVVFGNTDTVHMSQNSLYLPSPLYFSSPMRCLGCWWPNYGAGQNTLVHKMNLTTNLNYEGSKIIPGIPLSQYSMDEDAAGNFRILTKTWSPSLATQFFVFDKNFSLAGQLLNIEPGEEFKSSRYIGDKLYLVTFQQIDPLFVVDIANIKKPTIVGELKIPGYSTYLHPYEGLQGGIQYLIGLGYSTQENQRGGVTNDRVKLDLYKIDFNSSETAQTKCSSLLTSDVDATQISLCLSSSQPCSNDQMVYEACVHSVDSSNIAVSLLASHEFGGDQNYSPSLDNPRMFVWNSVKKQLQLPLIASEKQEVPYTGYNGVVMVETRYVPFFAGVKGLSVSPTQGFSQYLTQDFPAIREGMNRNGYYSTYAFNTARVGYIGEVNYFLLNGFVSFFDTRNIVKLGVY